MSPPDPDDEARTGSERRAAAARAAGQAGTGLAEDAEPAARAGEMADDTPAASLAAAPAPNLLPDSDRDPERRPPELEDPNLYINREVSWMQFNDRVLALAENPALALMERVKFCAIWTSNLDEHFMVRVAGLHDQHAAGVEAGAPDCLSPRGQIEAVRAAAADQQDRASRCFAEELVPALAEQGIRVISVDDASDAEREQLDERFREQIAPVLTPLAFGQGRPFPYISNLSLSLAVLIRDPEADTEIFARVKVPKEALPRFIEADGGEGPVLVPMEQLIAINLGELFPEMEIVDHAVFRVTRDLDYDVSDDAADLLSAVEEEVRRRRFGEVVRLELDADAHPRLREQLVEALRVDTELQVHEVDGLLDLGDAWEIVGLPGYVELRQRPWTPVTQPRLQAEEGGEGVDVFAELRRRDILVHHPYDSFVTSVERFVEQAVADPAVLAIKQTVYRTSDDSPLVPALIRATERGKQAVCMVELKARFDEEANIQWGKALEEAGVHVVYGVPNIKTHAKCILVVRREGEGVRRYCHVGTGNYHPTTAKLYTDLGLFTADPDIGADVSDMFNALTGYGRQRDYRKVLIAPTTARQRLLSEIHETVEAHENGSHARIALKMNALQDAEMIAALYEASQAGVPIDLNVRGICCLRPGVEGVSETISVVSVIGRFLEHSRIYRFERGDDVQVLTGSADWMTRNLDNRVELLAPVEDPQARAETSDILERSLADEANAWDLGSDGAWTKREPSSEPARDVHRELMDAAEARVAEGAQSAVHQVPVEAR